MTTRATIDRQRPESCLSDLLFDRLLAGELAGTAEGVAAEAHLGECAVCRGRRDALQGETARFGDEIFVDGLAAQAARRAAAGMGVRRWWPALTAVAGVAAALVLWRPLIGDGGERTKGGAVALAVVVRHSDGSTERVLPGGRLRPGEAIRFELSTKRAGYVGVVGMDAARAVTAYAPATGALPALAAGRAQLLPGSVVLDETLGAERIVTAVCTATRPVDELVAAARQALARAGDDPRRVDEIGSGCDEAAFTIEKVR